MLRQFIVEKGSRALSFQRLCTADISNACDMRRALLNGGPDAPLLALHSMSSARKFKPNMPVTGIAYVTAVDLLNGTEAFMPGRH